MTIFEAVCLFLLFYIHLYAFYSIDRIIVWNRQLLTYAKNGNIQKKTVYIQVYTLYQGISFYDKDPELESHNSYYRKNNDYTRLNLRRKKRPDNLTKITIKARRRSHSPHTRKARVTAASNASADLDGVRVTAWLRLRVYIAPVSRGREILVMISQGSRLS